MARRETFTDGFITLLPILIAHENAETRLSFPSLDRLAILAGMSKSSLPGAIEHLVKAEWLKVVTRQTNRGRTQHAYQMRYRRYENGVSDPTEWIRLDLEIIINGVWAAMSPATRRVYLVMRAYCLREERADGWVIEPDDLAGVDAEYAYLPAANVETAFLAEKTGLAHRTVRDALTWLYKFELAFATEDNQYPGLFIPFAPNLHSPAVMQALKKTQAKLTRTTADVSGYTLRGLRRFRRQPQRHDMPDSDEISW